jgi:hypothetical protein
MPICDIVACFARRSWRALPPIPSPRSGTRATGERVATPRLALNTEVAAVTSHAEVVATFSVR